MSISCSLSLSRTHACTHAHVESVHVHRTKNTLFKSVFWASVYMHAFHYFYHRPVSHVQVQVLSTSTSSSLSLITNYLCVPFRFRTYIHSLLSRRYNWQARDVLDASIFLAFTDTFPAKYVPDLMCSRFNLSLINFLLNIFPENI